ncbi:response regulator [Tundrisphaera sp. TA3]|uniref:hybrid sensor histidine kinase/response regulator n=1 Tax=Tundrisphaera sp. TA3 TaxID=3435775 RepID=UPI003EB9570C
MVGVIDPHGRPRPPIESHRSELILVVEDDPGVSRLESLRLRRAGYEVTCAATAEEARFVVMGGGVDLIVLDQKLQGAISGLDLYEDLRQDGIDLPAILVTGLSDEDTLIRAIRVGLRDFVPKTIDYLDDLTRAVDRVIQQVRTERRLAESEARLAGVTLLAEAIPQIVWTATEDGQIDYMNGRWFEYSGSSHSDALGEAWSRSVHPEDRDRWLDRWAESIETGRLFECEYRLRRADGEYRWFLGRAELVREASGKLVKWFGTCTDIDDQKRNEQELKQAHDLAESASLAKDQFLAMLSHELRTPLTPVLMTAAAARDDPDTPEFLRPTFELIRQNLELEARLIDDLLDVMRIIRGKMPYHFEPVDAHAQIRRAIEICRAEAEAKRLRVVVALDATEHHIIADAARWQQVLWNLIKNAVKFTPAEGSLLVRSRNADGRIIIDFVDSGIGIDPAHLPHIFNAFEQGEDATTKKFGGLGLGLAISRSVVEGHGGRIVASSPGKNRGSTFTVELPTSNIAPASSHDSADHPAAEPPPHRRILLVEDDVMTSRIMAKLLRQKGYTVTTANTVAGALAVPLADYDFIVSDIGLPDGSGLELMRNILPRHNIPGIALTGYGMEEDIRQSREAGFIAHLTKPLDFSKLDAMIRRVASEAGPIP